MFLPARKPRVVCCSEKKAWPPATVFKALQYFCPKHAVLCFPSTLFPPCCGHADLTWYLCYLCSLWTTSSWPCQTPLRGWRLNVSAVASVRPVPTFLGWDYFCSVCCSHSPRTTHRFCQTVFCLIMCPFAYLFQCCGQSSRRWGPCVISQGVSDSLACTEGPAYSNGLFSVTMFSCVISSFCLLVFEMPFSFSLYFLFNLPCHWINITVLASSLIVVS